MEKSRKRSWSVFALLFGALLMLFAGGIGALSKLSPIEVNGTSFSVTFKTGAGDGTSCTTSTACSDVISSGASYFTGNLVTATKVYHSGSNGLKVGVSGGAGAIKMNFASSIVGPTITVNAKRYNSSTNATISVNGATAKSTTSSFADYSFSFSGSTLAYLQIDASKYLWVSSLTVTYSDSSSSSSSSSSSDSSSSTSSSSSSSSSTSVESVSLDLSEMSIGVGKTRPLYPTVLPADATTKTVSWVSGNTSIATVSSSGIVTAVAAGDTTITVTTTDGGLTDTCDVHVIANTGGTFTLVESTLGISAGDDIIFVNHAGDYALRSLYTNGISGYCIAQSVSVSSKTVTLTSSSHVEVFNVEAGPTGYFRFHGYGFGGTETSHDYSVTKYLIYAPGDKPDNRLGHDERGGSSWTSDNTAWALSSYSSSSGMTVETKNKPDDKTRMIRFNSDRFSTYQSGTGTLVDIYKRTVPLSSIAVKTAPDDVSYTVGDTFDPTGLVITATYEDDSTVDFDYATYSSEFLFTPSTSTALIYGTSSVTIGFRGKTTTQSITVSYAAVTSISIDQGDALTVYADDLVELSATLSPSTSNPGITWRVVSAVKENAGGDYTADTDYVFEETTNENASLLMATDVGGTIVIEAKSDGDTTKTDTITITVDATVSLSLDITSITQYVDSEDDTEVLTATASHFGGTITWVWATDDDSVADVGDRSASSHPEMADVLLDTSAAGSATITVTATYGNQTATATCTVSIVPQQCLSFEISADEADLYDGPYEDYVDITISDVETIGTASGLDVMTWSLAVKNDGEADPTDYVTMTGSANLTRRIAAKDVSTDITIVLTVSSKYNHDNSLTERTQTCEITVHNDSISSLSWTNKTASDTTVFAGNTLTATRVSAWTVTATWASGKVESNLSFGTGRDHYQIQIQDSTAKDETNKDITSLPYTWAAADDGRYLAVLYNGARATRVQIHVVATLNKIAPSSASPTTVTWTAANGDAISSGKTGNVTCGDYTLAFSRSNNYVGFTGGDKLYHQIGSSGSGAGSITFSTPSDATRSITNVTVSCASGSGHVLNISVGGTSYASSAAMSALSKNYCNDMSYNGSSSGDISITIDGGTSGLWIHSISITWQPVSNLANLNALAQRAVVDFANGFNSLMEAADVCGPAIGDTPSPVNPSGSAFLQAWKDAMALYTSYFDTPNGNGTYGTYQLSSDNRAFAKLLLQYGYATWEDDERSGSPVERDMLQRALKTYDHVVLHYASQLQADEDIGDGYAFMSGTRTPSAAGMVFAPYMGNTQSPLTATLWIVLSCGIAGLGAIGTAYFVSKKKRHQA